MEETIPYNNSVFLTSIVNGLIATAILWTFWTPFIIFLVVPLVNAQIKNQVCEFASKLNIQGTLITIVEKMQTQGKISKHEASVARQWIESIQTPTPAADELIEKDITTMSDLNFNLMISMAFAAIVIVSLSMFLVGWMINHYNLNGPHIMKFNLVMALVIVLIEMTFFGTVAMRYVPFDPPKIIEALVQKIVNYLN